MLYSPCPFCSAASDFSAGSTVFPSTFSLLFWKSTPLLMAFCVVFVLGYCKVYWSIVKFRSPKWLHRRILIASPEIVENKI